MADRIALNSKSDGAPFAAYHVPPGDARRGGLVLVQEIFGLTDGIRDLADSFAAGGLEVIAPALFDRIEPGFQASFAPDDIVRARAASAATDWDKTMGDVQAAIDALAPPVFVTGFCWGGSVAWLAAGRCTGLAAASGFYGRQIVNFLEETPKCPTILHYGKTDHSIPLADVEKVRAAYPDLPVWLYEAGHGFMSKERPDYVPDAAHLARLRTLQLFHRAAGQKGEMGG